MFDAFTAVPGRLAAALPAAAAIILTVELLSRPRVIVKCVTIAVRYVKSEVRELLDAVRELRHELTHWDAGRPPTGGGVGPEHMGPDQTSARR